MIVLTTTKGTNTMNNSILAHLVTIPGNPSSRWPEHGCVAWLDRQDRYCGKPRTYGWLCTRHRTVAVKRYEKQATEIKERLDALKAAKA